MALKALPPGPAGAVDDSVRTVIKVATDRDTTFDLKAADKVAREMGYALSGRASGLNILANIWKQMEGKARKQREVRKEKKKADLKEYAAKWNRAHPEGEVMGLGGLASPVRRSGRCDRGGRRLP